MKKIFSKIKELYKLYMDPRYHDKVKLTVILLFFFIVVLFLRINVRTPSKKEESINNYEFTYQIDGVNIYGMDYDNAKVFVLNNNNKYFYDKDMYQVVGDKLIKSQLDLGILKVDYKMIDNLIGGLISSRDGNYNIYTIPLDRFINLYENDTDLDLSSVMSYNIIVKISDDKKKIILDLSNYYKLYNQNHDLIYIYINNINRIPNFKAEYEGMIK